MNDVHDEFVSEFQWSYYEDLRIFIMLIREGNSFDCKRVLEIAFKEEKEKETRRFIC